LIDDKDALAGRHRGGRARTLPELTAERAFAPFYTATVGSGAAAPIVYGVIGDKLGAAWATSAAATIALAYVHSRYPGTAPCATPMRQNAPET